MKKIKLLFLFVLFSLNLFSNESVWLNPTNEQITKESIINYLPTVLSCAKSMFVSVKEQTDNLGFTQISLQQKFNGVPIQGALILVQMKGMYVESIIGQYVPDDKLPVSQRIKINKVKAYEKAKTKIKSLQSSTNDFVLVNSPITNNIRMAYCIYVPERHVNVYIDVETGEQIYELPLSASSDIQGSAYTMYKGWQPFTCDYNSTGNYYRLMDNARQIVTLDASNSDPSSIYSFLNNINNYDESDTVAIKTAGQQAFSNFLSTCNHFGFSSSTCNMTKLSTVTISSIPDNSWYYSITDTKPDLYIKIKDNAGRLLYTSNYISDCTLPVLFDVNAANIYLSSTGYSIEIYDYDPIDDDFGGTITLSNISAGNYTWSGSSTTGSITISNFGLPHLDAHWGMQKVYDFYYSLFQRNSYDNNGSLILQFINPPHDNNLFSTMPNNAYAINFVGTPCKGIFPDFMVYGLGDGGIMTPVVALDVMAHEYTHLVTAYNGNGGLNYSGESGALNESFSDIMACAVDFYVNISPNWLIGEDVMILYSNMRSMAYPKNGMDGNSPQPDTYNGLYWYNTANPTNDNDNGGVHTNSGVQNKWFYLLSQGGSGKNDKNISYSVTGIGINKAQKIAYRNLIYKLTPTATHQDAYNGSLQAAKDLYGENSTEYNAAIKAWYAVGIGNGVVKPCIQNGQYIVLAQRTNSSNLFYMTSDIGTSSTKRFQAVDAHTNNVNNVVSKNLGSQYVWEVTNITNGIKLKNGSNYVTWNSGNSAALDATGKELNVSKNSDETYILSFPESTDITRFLSLNANAANNYFAFYGNSNQITALFFIPSESTNTDVIMTQVGNDISIISNHSEIIISGVNYGTILEIYSTSGILMYKQPVNSFVINPNLPKGIYIVKVSNITKKIVIQ